MINRFYKIFGVVLLSLMMGASSLAQDLVILHTNDVHSAIEPITSGYYSGLGGVQRRANYIQSIRENHPNVLLLDAGDYNQGTPYYTLFGGETEVMLYNALGYDATCLGNHEFDDGQAALAERLKKANYPTVCANYNFSTTPLKGLIDPYVVIHKGGRKIGIIGALVDLNGYVAKKGIAGLKYNNPIPIINKLAKQLKKKEGCDLVIVLSHLGYQNDKKNKPGDIEVAQNTKDVDIIIGGHSHTFLTEPTIVKNRAGMEVIVNQTGANGVYVGRIDINFNNR